MHNYDRMTDFLSKKSYLKAYLRAWYVIGIWRFPLYIKRLCEFLLEYRKIKAMKNLNQDFKLFASSPELWDKHDSSGAFGIYCYQDSWAFGHVNETKPEILVDIASSVYFVAFAAKITKVVSIDIRTLRTSIPTIEYRRGDITELPFENNSVEAISTLSVIEHIGLGRYGDILDLDGMEKGIKELIRVLKPGGMLLVAFPVGEDNIICFNAHRICTPEKVFEFFSTLDLIDEKYALSDKIISREQFDDLKRPYAYGCYRFTKKLPI